MNFRKVDKLSSYNIYSDLSSKVDLCPYFNTVQGTHEDKENFMLQVMIPIFYS